MILRWLVANLLRQAAERQIRETVSQTLRNRLAEVANQHSLAPGDPSSTAPQEPAPTGPCEIAFVFALGIESGGLIDRLSEPATLRRDDRVEHAGQLSGRAVVVMESGIGEKRAAQATEELIALRQPAWVVSAGFAGALCDDLRRGHILMADSVADEQGRQLSVGLKLDAASTAQIKGLHVGRLLTVARLLRPARRRMEAPHEAVAKGSSGRQRWRRA